MGHTLIVLPHGSYIYQDHEEETLLGKAYRLKNGVLEQVTRDGDALDMRKLY
jgi:hypothetical protein